VEECKKVLNLERDIIVKAFGKIALERKIVIEDMNEEESEGNSKAVYRAELYVSEEGISHSLKKLLNAKKMLRLFDIEIALEWVQKELSIILAENQIKAVKESIQKKLMVITGGPGTGKTTIINSIIKIYKRLGQRVLLAAPTGRASKRMTEATGHEAKTIHRLLEFSPTGGRFKRSEQNPLEADLIVIDETSMVDTILMYHFLKAVPITATLILVGDMDQLPSIGPGNVLKDIIESGVVPTVKLHEIFRQSRESLIIINAHKVNNGEMPILTHNKDRLQDFYFFQIEEPEKILEKIISLCKEKIPERFKFDFIRDIQVLTAMHKGIIGASNLNLELQKVLNPSTDELIRGSKVFKSGDKVMQIINNYDKDVYNGDIGVITRIDKEDQGITVDYDGKSIIYDYKDLDEIVLAYCISVHKSQGSEYLAVVMPVHTQHYMLLQRNLLYTGITRGKRLVVLIGTKKAMAIAIRNNKPQKRYTYLKNRLVKP
jgi:exodeoxyribonuclease V alpha subunit